MSNVIQFKRNPGVTGPTTSELVAGEPAIAMDGPTGANSKLYIGISDGITGSTTSVVPIGGAYYTNYVDTLISDGVVNTVNGITGDVEILDGVLTFNGATGNIQGVSSVNGITGDVEILDGVLTFNGATGNIIGVSSVNGATGAVTNVVTTSSGTQSIAGVKTFSDEAIFSGGVTANEITATTINGTGICDFYRLSYNGTEFSASASEINTCCDGNTLADASYTAESTDKIIVNDGGIMKQVTFDRLELWAEANLDTLSNVTSIGTLTSLTVDNIFINGNTIGHTVDTDLITITGGLMTVAGNIAMAEDAWIGNESANAIHFNDVSSSRLDMRCNEVKFENLLGHYGDADTYLKFDADQFTIHCGGADQIVATTNKVAMGDIELERPKLKDYSETVNAIGSVNSNTAVNFEDGNVQTVTIGGNCEFSFSNPPSSGIAGTVTLIITNGGAHTTTWHSSVKWPGDVAPTLTTSGVDIVSFMTIDAGTTTYGFVGGINFS